MLDICNSSKPIFNAYPSKTEVFLLFHVCSSWTYKSTREPGDKTAYIFDPAELGMLAPDVSLTFSAWKNFTDCKHTLMEYSNKSIR